LHQICVQRAARVKEACPHGEDGSAHDFRNLGGREPFNLVEHVHGAFLFAHAVEQAIQGRDAAPSRELLVRLVVVADDGVVGRVDGRRAAPKRAPVHEDDVDGDPVDPRAEPSFTPKAAQALMHLHEDLLHQIFEVRAATRHAVDQTSHAGAVFAEELAECRGLAGLAPRDQVAPVAPVAHDTEGSAFRRRALARRVHAVFTRRRSGPGPPADARYLGK